MPAAWSCTASRSGAGRCDVALLWLGILACVPLGLVLLLIFINRPRDRETPKAGYEDDIAGF